MSPVDAFLIVTAIAYYVAGGLSRRKFMINVPLVVEKVLMAIAGTVLVIGVMYFPVALFFFGVASAAASILTFSGYIKWYIAYKHGPSDAAQALMCVWDILVAVCCFIKLEINLFSCLPSVIS